jgi:type II secretory pathway component PulK
MGFRDEVLADTLPVRRTKMDDIRDTLGETDYAEFLEALTDPTISNASIRRVLQKRGVTIGVATISIMRREYVGNQ